MRPGAPAGGAAPAVAVLEGFVPAGPGAGAGLGLKVLATENWGE